MLDDTWRRTWGGTGLTAQQHDADRSEDAAIKDLDLDAAKRREAERRLDATLSRMARAERVRTTR